ncbi:MAG TPA: hypothetical protein PLS07_00715 [Niabella sp.]|nr:hypothetical protein [Niabella sp.]HQW14270.1 hypothetical protein [Niabella sp.]HQX18450.1 hypothetical protein [Niabella sp.]HQX40058.1 hypothetical protein [Niabella sp.]HRB05977.1 hypothetical protein [Niabella sp.]
MKTYLLTSTEFEGEVLFRFDQQGLLMQFDLTGATLTALQMQWLNNRMPRTLSELKTVLKSSKQARLTEQKQTAVSFDQFWKRPDGRCRWPANSSKKKAEKKWNQLAQRQQDRAYNYLEAYLHQIPDGVAMMYAETYLNKELWNN